VGHSSHRSSVVVFVEFQDLVDMRLAIFDLIDSEGWPLPVEISIDYSQGFPDVIVSYDSQDAAS